MNKSNAYGRRVFTYADQWQQIEVRAYDLNDICRNELNAYERRMQECVTRFKLRSMQVFQMIKEYH